MPIVNGIMANVKGLTPDEIERLLAQGRPSDPAEKRLQQAMQMRVQAKEAARREDTALAPEVRDSRRVYDNVVALAELKRDVLAKALDALDADSGLRVQIAQLLSEWEGRSPVQDSASAQQKIEGLRAGRDEALAHAGQCSTALAEAATELGEEHPLSAGLIDAAAFNL